MSSPSNLLVGKQKTLQIKNKSEYELYEDDLNNYKNKNKSNLQEWNMISSRIISPQLMAKSQAEGSQVAKQRSLKKEKIQGKLAEISTISQTTHKTETANAYSAKVKRDFEETEGKSNQQLQKDLKSMRDMLHELNLLVTSKLNKYELAQFVPKGMANVNEPQKEEQIVKAKIETNKRILEALQKEIKQIQQTDKDLEEKDYLIQLQESSNLIFRTIKEKKREKHGAGVAVEKLDGKLIQMREAEQDDQYKMVKVLKHNILYYFKKFNQNKSLIAELDQNYKNLVEKDEQISKKYAQFAKIAEQKNMLVKANRSYLENKKIFDQLLKKSQQAKRKIDVVKRSKQVESEKIDKEVEWIKKQTALTQQRIKELTTSTQQFVSNINQTIERHKISNKMINKISYKFTEALLKESSGNTGYSGNQVIAPEEDTKKRIFSKPKVKITRDSDPINTTVQGSNRYQTLNVQSSEPKEEKHNDKNLETIEFLENKSRDFRIKPNMSIKKRGQNKSRLDESADMKTVDKGNEIDINFKPKRFQKILSSRKEKESA